MSADADRDERLAQALRPYLDDPSRGVLLAVSGGPDSTALMHAAARLGAASVATIDHGLRSDSGAEALAVGKLAVELGLRHRVLLWTSPRTGSGIQAAARTARYAMLAEHALAIGAASVLTGHTADDQAETVLMRLIAGSGPSGLVGMRRERVLGQGVRLARPFLDLPKSDLVAYCEAHRLPFVRDPSNLEDRFERARLRRLMPRLAEEGLSGLRLRRLAERLARDEIALACDAARALHAVRRPSEPGSLRLDGRMLASEPEAIVLRIVEAGLSETAAGFDRPTPSRLERLERLVLERLLPALRVGAPFRATLRGIVVDARAGGELRLSPAPPRRAARQSPPQGGLAAAPPDLLGNVGTAAYIDSESVE